MQAFIKSPMITVENNIITKTMYNRIKKTEDFWGCLEAKYCQDGVVETFTPESLYLKTGKTLADVTLSAEEKNSIFKVKINGEEYSIPGDRVIVIPVSIKNEFEDIDIINNGMTLITNIDTVVRSDFEKDTILDEYEKHRATVCKNMRKLDKSGQMYYSASYYSNADHVFYYNDKYKKDHIVDVNKFLFVLFVTPYVVYGCSCFDDKNTPNHAELKFGLISKMCIYENNIEYCSPNADCNESSVDFIVDYTTYDDAKSVVINQCYHNL